MNVERERRQAGEAQRAFAEVVLNILHGGGVELNTEYQMRNAEITEITQKTQKNFKSNCQELTVIVPCNHRINFLAVFLCFLCNFCVFCVPLLFF